MEHLKQYLARHGLTQDAFAKLGGWRQATVSDWTTGRKTPSTQNAWAIEKLTSGEVPMVAWAAADEAAA